MSAFGPSLPNFAMSPMSAIELKPDMAAQDLPGSALIQLALGAGDCHAHLPLAPKPCLTARTLSSTSARSTERDGHARRRRA
jgi:hypothetical protein